MDTKYNLWLPAAHTTMNGYYIDDYVSADKTRRKSDQVELIRVLKSAIWVSKSQTGKAVFDNKR